MSLVECLPDRRRMAQELADSLDAMRGVMVELGALAADKLAALRAGRLDALQECARQESAPLAQMDRQRSIQQALLAGAAQGLPAARGAALRAHEFAACLDEPERSRILAKIEGLRAAAATLRDKNDRLARVARSLLCHVRAVFGDVARAHQETVVYGAGGKPSTHTRDFWVDAVG